MRHIVTIGCLLATLTVVGCGKGTDNTTDNNTLDTGTSQSSAVSQPPTAAVVKNSKIRITVYTEPSKDASVKTILNGTTRYGTATSFRILDTKNGWYYVAVNSRPDGTRGWIDGALVDAYNPAMALAIDLHTRKMTITQGSSISTTSVGIGSTQDPTPPGDYFVTDLLRSTNPAYGTFAIGLSAHSPVLTEFSGGDGQIGIHGTNDPRSIGAAVSHGCVRLPTSVDARLSKLAADKVLVIGTYVHIT